MSQSTATQLHERLLEHHGFVRRLARGLVLDAAEADDVVQETWLAVMKRPPQEIRQPRPWLAGVVRKVVQGRYRTDYRRQRREQVAARPESVPADSDLLLRAELQRKVLDATLELEEPYRSTVLRRYFDERSCGEIARREGVPASTVRNRLKRALSLLRGHLELSGTTSRDVWVAFLALAGFGSGARVAAAEPAAQAPLTKETTMGTTKLGIVLGGLAVSGVLVTLAVGEEVATSSDTSHAAPAPRAVAAERTPAKDAPTAKSDDARMKARVAALEERVRARYGKGATVKVKVTEGGGLRGKSKLTDEAMKRALQLTDDQMARIETLGERASQRWRDLMHTPSEDGTTPHDLQQKHAEAYKKAREEGDGSAMFELQRKMNAYRGMKIRGSEETFAQVSARGSLEHKQAFSAILTEKQRELYADMEYMSKFAQPIKGKSHGVSISVTIPHKK